MKIMGVDISSKSTGWAVIEGDKLLDYGKVNPTGKMTTAQKLFLFHIELKKIIDRQQPCEIAIEDVVQVKSVSVVKILARFNGVAMIEAYRYLQREPEMFEPSKWKKLMDGCTGASKKCEIQVAICEKYKLLSLEKIKAYRQRINDAKVNFKEGLSKDELHDLQHQLKKAKKANDKALIGKLSTQINDAKLDLKKFAKTKKKEMTNIFDDISMEIYTESSINEDIADAAGVAIAFQKLHG